MPTVRKKEKKLMAPLCTDEKVIALLNEKVGVPADIANIETATWKELGLESLALSEVFTNLEIDLDIEIPFDQAMKTKNVQELVSFINTTLL
jgi:acyl carrier protein